jgi:hypothetical protein
MDGFNNKKMNLISKKKGKNLIFEV